MQLAPPSGPSQSCERCGKSDTGAAHPCSLRKRQNREGTGRQKAALTRRAQAAERALGSQQRIGARVDRAARAGAGGAKRALRRSKHSVVRNRVTALHLVGVDRALRARPARIAVEAGRALQAESEMAQNKMHDAKDSHHATGDSVVACRGRVGPGWTGLTRRVADCRLVRSQRAGCRSRRG